MNQQNNAGQGNQPGQQDQQNPRPGQNQPGQTQPGQGQQPNKQP